MIYLSPAKVNLTLNITGRDPKDGYHYIDSIFDPISLYDLIEIKKSKRNEVRVSVSTSTEKIPVKNNLVYKAAKLFKEYCNIKTGFSIRLTKNIPSGAGLGGGSSNAATTLVALNDICKTGLTNKQLSKLAFELGSDVPFFIFNRPARVTGKGEKLSFLVRNQIFWYVLIKKNVHISTKKAYLLLDKKYNLTYDSAYNKLNYNKSYSVITLKNIKVFNDFESVIYKEYTRLKQVKKVLKKYKCINAGLSGSGATVFALFETKAQAEKCFLGVRQTYPKDFVYVAHSI